MSTFEAVLSYSMKNQYGGQYPAEACIRVEAPDADAAQQKITATFQCLMGRPAESDPDPWIPLVTDWVKSVGADHVLFGDVMQGALGMSEYSASGASQRRVIAILRGLG